MFTKKSALLFLLAGVTAVLFLILSLSPSQAVSTIFSDNFNTGYAGWSSSGNVSSVSSPAVQPNSVRLRQTGQIWRTVSTVGYSSISVTWTMAAQSLESNEFCYAEINTGSGWSVIATLADGQDNSVFNSGTVSLSAAADNNANFQVRYRIAASSTGDYCYGENLTISGTAGTPPTNTPTPTPTITPTPPPGGSVPGDPLTGNGNTGRTLLTYSQMINGASTATPISETTFALPTAAAHPANTFEGRLELHNEASSGSYYEVRDDFNYSNNPERLHIPEFDFEFVQNGSHLIPARRGLIVTSHPYWNYILEPGRVWQENGDNGYSRASFPFALSQKNANCTHNGTITFLFNNSGAVSKAWYQVTQETCLYFKGNFWGQLNATYHPGAVANAAQLRANYVQEVIGRFPSKPISDLAVDYPGFDLNTLHNYLQSQQGSGADIFNMLVNDVFVPIGMGPGAFSSLRTADNNWQGQAFGGYGLWLIQDDVAKIVTLLNNEGGAHGGNQILHPGLLNAAMQRDAADRGLNTANQPFKYNNGFWAHEFTTADGYPCNFYIPFMSGYGGITIVMMRNGATFYHFSDNDEFSWYDVVQEAHEQIGSQCQ
jgi:hypothetical protein